MYNSMGGTLIQQPFGSYALGGYLQSSQLQPGAINRLLYMFQLTQEAFVDLCYSLEYEKLHECTGRSHTRKADKAPVPRTLPQDLDLIFLFPSPIPPLD